MSRRPLLSLAVGSLMAVAAVVGLLVLSVPPPLELPLEVLCAAALRPAMEETVAGYRQESGRRVWLTFGNSGEMLARAAAGHGNLFLPADDSFVRLAEEKGEVAESVPLARMRAVLLTRPGNPRGVARLDDLLAADLKLAQANPDAAAIGRVTRDHLRRLGRWDELAANTAAYQTTVSEAANAVEVGSADAAVVWDVVAAQYPELTAVRLPELDGAVGRVELAVLKSARSPEAARHFVRYVRDPEKGGRHFRAAGFTDLDPGPTWAVP